MQSGTVEMCHTASYYYFGKDPTFAFGTCIPFGLNSRMQTAWMYFGGGMELMNDFYRNSTSMAFRPATPARRWAAGSARRSRRVADLNGLKMRIGGFAGRVISKLGVVPQQIAGGDIYPALEKGTLDACEWVGPYDDEKLGFHKVAQYYYYPGWWEGGPMIHNFINLDKWNELPPAYKSIIRTASSMANEWMQARYDAANPAALKRLVAGGAQLRPFSQPIMDASLESGARALCGRSQRPIPTSRKSGKRCSLSATTNIYGGRSRSLLTTPIWCAIEIAPDCARTRHGRAWPGHQRLGGAHRRGYAGQARA